MTILVQQQLRDLAGRASRGPWKSAEKDNWRGRAVLAQRSEGYLFRAFAFCRSDQRVPGSTELDIANAEFIAAANPSTVMALLDEIEQLKAENSELRRNAEQWRELMIDHAVEIEACAKAISSASVRKQL